MKEDEFVIFAELDRDKFEEILERLMTYFQGIRFGRQGDDWIWVNFEEGKIEIDSFFSNNLEVKGTQGQLETAARILDYLEKTWILKRFNPPKPDLTR